MDSSVVYQSSEQYETIQSGRLQTRLIWIVWATLAVVLTAEIWWGNRIPAIFIAGSGVLLLIPYWLTKRGYVNASGLILVVFVLATLTSLSTLGKGIHDIAAIAFPLVIIFSSLALNRSGFVIGVLLTLSCIGWLVFGEATEIFVPLPSDKSDFFDFIIVSSIMISAALIVNALVHNMRQSLEKAKQEIEQRKQVEDILRAKTEEIDHYFSANLDLFCIADLDGYFRRLNPQWQETLGYPLEELEGIKFLDLVHPNDLESTLAAVSRLSAQEAILNFENRYRCKDGTYRWLEWRSMPAGNLIYASARDITDRKQMEDQLRYQGTHDILTGIYNRSFFEAELARLEGGREYPISIILGDIDGLKKINDTQGHAAGDRLLKQAAAILKTMFRTEDVLARIGGDEFAVLMPNTDSESVERKMDGIREKLLENNADPSNFPVNISIGAATAEQGDLIGAFTLADQRMYQDKTRRTAKPDMPVTA